MHQGGRVQECGRGRHCCRATPMPMPAFLLAVAVAAPVVAAAASWTRGKGASVSVDPATFAYSIDSPGATGACALATGGVSLNCDGAHYSSTDGGLKLSGRPALSTGTDPKLGPFEAIGAAWAASKPACGVHTEIRYFASVDAIVFAANFSASGVPRTNTSYWAPSRSTPSALEADVPYSELRAGIIRSSSAPGCEHPDHGCIHDTHGLVTAFPTWPLPDSTGTSCSYYSYASNSLGRNWRAGALGTWGGGLEGGPLLLYPSSSTAEHPPAMLLSPLNHPKSLIGSLHVEPKSTAKAVTFGVQGLVEELPPAFSQEVLLVGREGIAATQMAWGATLRQRSNTSRLTLDEDILNSKVTYWTDNGAYYCYCNTFRSNPDRRVPMHIIMKNLTDYHTSLGLNITMYHLDSGWWHSAHADGHCDGVTASNWSASQFHWPHTTGPDGRYGDGLGSKVWGQPTGETGTVAWQMLYMLLAGSECAAARPGNETALGNVYGDTYDVGAVRPQGGPWPMQVRNVPVI